MIHSAAVSLGLAVRVGWGVLAGWREVTAGGRLLMGCRRCKARGSQNEGGIELPGGPDGAWEAMGSRGEGSWCSVKVEV